jgi:drug/metabolite transporter superfamily protein YnfA
MLFSGIFIMLVLIACSYVYTNLTPQNIVLGTYVLTIILGIIILLTLSILFTIINTHLRSYTGWGGIFIRLLFYLPCLLIDFVEYMKQQFKLTTNTTYILFITELILIIFYLYFPKLATKVLSGTNGTPILSDSRFLTHEYSLNINNMMIKDKKSNKPHQETTKTTYREDFAISMWTYINPQPDNYSAYHNESNIFTFADNTPRITYYNKPDDINSRNKLVFYYKEDQYTITNEPQKWTNIVLNYSSNNLDIFINGELKRTFTITEPNNYDTLNEIVIGSKNGLDGAICNIAFFNKTLSKFEINNIYKLLMNKNPPVNEY